MYLERLEDLSVYYFLKDVYSSAPFIKIEDGFPEGDLSLPTVAVEAGRINIKEYELGNRDGLRVRTWYIEIFAKNKSQRDEFGYKLLNELKNGVPVYNYNEGFPPDVTPTKIGVLTRTSTLYEPVPVTKETHGLLYYRASIQFVAYNEVLMEV